MTIEYDTNDPNQLNDGREKKKSTDLYSIHMQFLNKQKDIQFIDLTE